jgi:formylglycine-generating enzyme required for sulfatase activity
MSGKIFINYRRELSQADALHLSTVLIRQFGRNRIFIDTHGIDGFSDWLNVLKQQVAGTAAMIAVIGPGWLDVTDDKGNRRLDNPLDFVRFEITEALSRDIPVLPVLLHGAEVPSREQLPEDMRGMLRRQAMHLQARRFEEDAADIARALRKILRRRRVVPLWAAAGLAITALGGGIYGGPDILRQADRLFPGLNLAPLNGPEALQDELKRLRQALAEAERDERAARSELEAAQSQIAALERDKARLEQERSAAISARDQAQERAQAAEAARAQAQATIEQRQARVSALERRVAGLKADLEAREADIAALRGAAKAGTAEAVAVRLATGETKRIVPGAGESFKDCAECPEMVVVPAGRFMMGSSEAEIEQIRKIDDWWKENAGREGPLHEVAIPEPFAVGRFAVTFDEWDTAQADADWQRVTGLEPRKPDARGWGRGNRPVIHVSWDDAQAYAKWLSARTGKTYRLLSEAEWEYAARAGTTSRYWFGDDNSQLGEHAWFSANSGGKTHPVGQKTPNSWGLHDVYGNVYEWVEDCWNASYAGKPDRLKASGAALTAGDCSRRVLRGGSWSNIPRNLRSASRGWSLRGNRDDSNGFRLARTLTP